MMNTSRRDLDRIDTDMEMMTRAGINVIRIGESTWSTCEPQPGHFDWTHIDRALDAATNAGINVIVGTPTYAVPTWLVAMYPDVLAITPAGEPHYGARQIMNIVNPAYRLYGEEGDPIPHLPRGTAALRHRLSGRQ